MGLSHQKELELEKKLLEIALSEFDYFCQITGVDKVQAFVCLERKKGRTYGSIGQNVGISKQAVHKRCKRCN